MRNATSHCVDEGEVVGHGEDDVLGVLDKPVVLGMEDMMDGGEADILVHAAVAGDEVRIEQLVVVDAIVALPSPIAETDRRCRRLRSCRRNRLVGDVGQKGMTGPNGAIVEIEAAVAHDDDVVDGIGNAVRADSGK